MKTTTSIKNNTLLGIAKFFYKEKTVCYCDKNEIMQVRLDDGGVAKYGKSNTYWK